MKLPHQIFVLERECLGAKKSDIGQGDRTTNLLV